MKSEKKDSNLNCAANDFKDQGNKCFSHRKYNEAISCYTKAIVS